MEILDYDTKLFENIFSDYDTFKEWYTSTPLSDSEDDVPNEKTFTLILYEYADSHVAFSVESFKQHFANVLYTYYKEFEATTKAIDDLMALSDDDVKINSTFITNAADIPETTSDTDTETVDYISAQQKNIDIKGNVQIKREQLSNKRTYTVKTFLNRFKKLFVRICSLYYTPVYQEDEGE